VVFNEEIATNIQKGKGLPQKEPKQVFPYIEERKFDLYQNIFPKSVPPPKIIEKQVNPS
jgi:hypothetical protein